MRHGIRASTTGLLTAALFAFCAASCARPSSPPPPPTQPPARVLVVTEGRIALETSAYVELHLRFAAAARVGEEPPPDLETAQRAYARALQDDDDDRLLARTTRALSACSDDRCASTAVAAEGFGDAFARALPVFAERAWLPRASAAWTAIEAAHAALGATGPAAEALFTRAAGDLGITWPERAVPVDVVSEAPPLGRDALAPVALAARGSCFVRDRSADERVARARLLDCILIHALLAARDPELAGPIRRTLARRLAPREDERAWSVLVIHTAAAVMTAWEPRHRSVYRRSAEVTAGPMLSWLAREWRGGASSESPEAFAERYVERWRELRAARATAAPD